MALVREQPAPKKARQPHTIIPIHGEWGRYSVNSRSAAKKGLDETYIVDVLAEEDYNGVKVVGVCPCKGFQVRKKCSHLDDAREFHEKVATVKKASALGFDNVNAKDQD